MAKKNRTKMLGSALGSDYSPTIHLDVDALSELKDLSVGDSVTVILQGKVQSVGQSEGYGTDSKVQGNLCLKDYEVKITGPDEWAEMADEDDD